MDWIDQKIAIFVCITFIYNDKLSAVKSASLHNLPAVYGSQLQSSDIISVSNVYVFNTYKSVHDM